MVIKRQFGIKLKITMAFSLIFILLSFAVNLYYYREVRNLLIGDSNKYLLSRANSLLDKTEISPAIIPLPEKGSDIRVFYHSAGKVYVLFESPGIIKKIKIPQRTGVTDTLGMQVAYVTNSSEENPVELMLIRSPARLTANLRFLLLLLFGGSILSVLFAGLTSYILASYLLQPVQRIINAAKKITTNKLRDVIPVNNTNDELQELTETINSMLIRIDESLQQQQNFFASASHELKTPLAIMQAELEVNLKKQDVNTGLSTLLASQLAEINRLQQVVQEFLLVSQLKSGGISLYKEPTDVSALILRLFNRLMPLLVQKGLHTNIDFNKKTESFTINADKDKLWITLMNLVENAIKYGTPESVITCNVGPSADQQYLAISIVNKIKIEGEPTKNLTEAFHQRDAAADGAGLGLWLCDQIICLHGGKLEISSGDFSFTVVALLPVYYSMKKN